MEFRGHVLLGLTYQSKELESLSIQGGHSIGIMHGLFGAHVMCSRLCYQNGDLYSWKRRRQIKCKGDWGHMQVVQGYDRQLW